MREHRKHPSLGDKLLAKPAPREGWGERPNLKESLRFWAGVSFLAAVCVAWHVAFGDIRPVGWLASTTTGLLLGGMAVLAWCLFRTDQKWVRPALYLTLVPFWLGGYGATLSKPFVWLSLEDTAQLAATVLPFEPGWSSCTHKQLRLEVLDPANHSAYRVCHSIELRGFNKRPKPGARFEVQARRGKLGIELVSIVQSKPEASEH